MIHASERFYRALGLSLDLRSRGGGWSELAADGGLVALHTVASADSPREPGEVELCLVTDAPLEGVARRLDAEGFAHDVITDEAFGRVLRAVDPDGKTLQINENDPSLYT